MLPDQPADQPDFPPVPAGPAGPRRPWGRGRLRQLLRGRGRVGFIMGLVLGLTLGHWVIPLLRGDPGPEPGDLIVVADRDSSVGKQRQALLATWNATHPNHKAHLIELSGRPEDQYAELAGRASSGRYNADVYSLDVIWMAEFVDAGYLRPLDERRLNTDGFIAKLVETCRFSGTLWGLPFNTDAGLLYYRTDRDLVTAPVMTVPQSNGKRPFTWEDIATQTADVFASPDRPTPLVAGYVGQLKGYEGLTVNATEAIFAAQSARGDEIRHGGVVLDTPQANAGLQVLASYLAGDNSRPQVIAPESLTADEARSTQLFRDGKVLFMRNWPVAYRNLSESDDGMPPPVPFNVTTLPGPSVLGGQNLAIASTSTHPRAAQELIEYLTDSRSQQLLFERGGFAATRAEVYHDQSVVERYPYAPVLLAAVKEAEPRPVNAHYAQFSRAFQKVALRVIQGGAPINTDDIDLLKAARLGRVSPSAHPS